MTNQRVADRYAKSLLDLSLESDQFPRIKRDVDALREMIASSRELEVLLASPVVNPSQKKKVLKEILTQSSANELTKTFVDVVIGKGREGDLVGILKAFDDQYKKMMNVSTVEVTSAKELTDAELQSIKQQLVASGKTTATVELETKVDPAIIGGFILEFDGKVYDASVRHKLNQLRKEIA